MDEHTEKEVGRRATLYCGTSNVVLPVPNKLHFPPDFQEKSRLCFYGSLFNTVEVNQTFYKIPLRKTVERWTSEVPDNFKFTFKLWKGITHAKELIYEKPDLASFMNVIDAAGSKKGALLIQFPASIKYSYFQKVRVLLDALSSLDETANWKLAVEFRDSSWYKDSTYQLLERYHAAIVIHDMPKSLPPALDMETDFTYLRFHGPQGTYRGSYDEDWLQEQCERIACDVRSGKAVFAYFNNTMGAAVHNALALQDLFVQMQNDEESGTDF